MASLLTKKAKRTIPEPEIIEVSVNGKTVRVTQAIFITGIFPIPARIRQWAGFK